MARNLTPHESDEQAALFHWAAYAAGKHSALRLLYHIPNGGSRNAREAHNLKLQGVKPGVPDIFLSVARGGYHGLYIELKRRRGGRLSAEQAEWLELLNAEGYRAVVCKGWEEARAEIEDYLKL